MIAYRRHCNSFLYSHISVLIRPRVKLDTSSTRICQISKHLGINLRLTTTLSEWTPLVPESVKFSNSGVQFSLDNLLVNILIDFQKFIPQEQHIRILILGACFYFKTSLKLLNKILIMIHEGCFQKALKVANLEFIKLYFLTYQSPTALGLNSSVARNLLNLKNRITIDKTSKNASKPKQISRPIIRYLWAKVLYIKLWRYKCLVTNNVVNRWSMAALKKFKRTFIFVYICK